MHRSLSLEIEITVDFLKITYLVFSLSINKRQCYTSCLIYLWQRERALNLLSGSPRLNLTSVMVRFRQPALASGFSPPPPPPKCNTEILIPSCYKNDKRYMTCFERLKALYKCKVSSCC